MTDDLNAKEQTALAMRLREAREYLGWSQQYVADQTGIPRSAVSDIERGLRRVDSLELQRLSKLYRWPVSYFLGENDDSGDTATVLALRLAAKELTEEDQQEVLRFASFLRHHGRAQGGDAT